MQIIITEPWWAPKRTLYVSGIGLARMVVILLGIGIGIAMGIFFATGAAMCTGNTDSNNERERFIRENVQTMGQKMGELQAKLLQLDELAVRVSGMSGVPIKSATSADNKNTHAKNNAKPTSGLGGPLFEVDQNLNAFSQKTDSLANFFIAAESHFFDSQIKKLMIPTQEPVPSATVGSPFGWRTDPFMGSSAMHSGLDFQASTGTPILAAAGGVVVRQELSPSYGNMLDIDHGNGLLTRYAHASKIDVLKGDLIKRGQKVAEVGSTGRSTGPHLHFEVLVNGVPQDPQRFLNAGKNKTQ